MLILVGLTAGPNWLSFLETLKKFENYNFIILFGIKELNKLWKKIFKTIHQHVLFYGTPCSLKLFTTCPVL